MNQLQMDELMEWERESDQNELQQRFEITGLDSLSWAFRKLAAIQAKELEIETLVSRELDRIKYWEQSQKQSLQQDKDFFQGLIHQYHAKQLEADPKAKTLSTPYGKSKARATKAQPDKTDDKALLEHIKSNQMTEYIKEDVKWGDFKKTLKIVEVNGNQLVLDSNGQIVVGVDIKPASISFSLEVE